MLSRRLNTTIRSNAVASLYEKQDVFLHHWLESCATVCALRIIISEQESEATKSDGAEEDILSVYASHLRMRLRFRDAVFRLHVPRTIEPTRIGRDLWAPLKISSSGGGSGGGDTHQQQPPFTDAEFQRWIETTSRFPAAQQVGGEGYVPLPCFISSIESLANFKSSSSSSSSAAAQVMGKRPSVEQHQKLKKKGIVSSPFSLRYPAGVHAIGATTGEAEPYQKLLRYLGEGAKSDFENFVTGRRELPDEHAAEALFRAALVHGGGSSDAQFGLSLVRDLKIGDLMVADESEESLQQFSYALRQSAKEASAIRGLSTRARTFLSSSSTSGGSEAAKCFPGLIEGAATATSSSNGASSNPSKRPYSKRPDELARADDDASKESDFNLCCWTSPVEPLLFDPLAAEPRSFWSRHRRNLKLSSERDSVAATLRQLAPPIVSRLLFGSEQQEETTIEQGLSARATESLRNFDSELLRRLSSDVGGFAAAIVPCCVPSSAIDQQEQQTFQDSFETLLASSLLPNFSSGRLRLFPSVLGAHAAPLAPIWPRQFIASSTAGVRARSSLLHFEPDDIIAATLGGGSDDGGCKTKQQQQQQQLSLMAADPFSLAYFNTTNPGAVPPLGFCYESMLLPLVEKLNGGDSNNNSRGIADDAGASLSSRSPYLCLLVMKAPPGLTSARHEEDDDKQQQQKHKRGIAASSSSEPKSDSSSNIVFSNTWEYDHYLPKSGPPVPHHYADHAPTFSFLDDRFIARRKAELERRQLHGAAPHQFSDLLFPPHSSRVHSLVGSADDAVAFGFDDDADAEQQASSSSPASRFENEDDSVSFNATDFLQNHLSADQRNALKLSHRGATSPEAAHKKLRDAQLQFGTIGAIFRSDLKKKQLSKAALQKQISRDVDRHLNDERFMNEKVLPAGEVTAAVHNELLRVRIKSPGQIAMERKRKSKKF